MITAYCPACWTEVPVGATDCAACGADIASLDAAEFDEKLLRALRHPEAATRLRAAEILGRRRTPNAVSALLDRWREGADPYLGAEISRALGRIGGEQAEAALREVAADPSVVVRAAVREALVHREKDDSP
jgi:HEAT repeat protein